MLAALAVTASCTTPESDLATERSDQAIAVDYWIDETYADEEPPPSPADCRPVPISQITNLPTSSPADGGAWVEVLKAPTLRRETRFIEDEAAAVGVFDGKALIISSRRPVPGDLIAGAAGGGYVRIVSSVTAAQESLLGDQYIGSAPNTLASATGFHSDLIAATGLIPRGAFVAPRSRNSNERAWLVQTEESALSDIFCDFEAVFHQPVSLDAAGPSDLTAGEGAAPLDMFAPEDGGIEVRDGFKCDDKFKIKAKLKPTFKVKLNLGFTFKAKKKTAIVAGSGFVEVKATAMTWGNLDASCKADFVKMLWPKGKRFTLATFAIGPIPATIYLDPILTGQAKINVQLNRFQASGGWRWDWEFKAGYEEGEKVNESSSEDEWLKKLAVEPQPGGIFTADAYLGVDAGARVGLQVGVNIKAISLKAYVDIFVKAWASIGAKFHAAYPDNCVYTLNFPWSVNWKIGAGVNITLFALKVLDKVFETKTMVIASGIIPGWQFELENGACGKPPEWEDPNTGGPEMPDLPTWSCHSQQPYNSQQQFTGPTGYQDCQAALLQGGYPSAPNGTTCTTVGVTSNDFACHHYGWYWGMVYSTCQCVE